MKFIKRSTGHIKHYASLLVGLSMVSCAFNANQQPSQAMDLKSASELLGNPDYPAISYGGYRGKSREEQPNMAQLKEDIRIMHAMGIRFLRTYNLQFPHAANVVKAIDELKNANPEFEMYVMLGVWIDCAGAWTTAPDHTRENYEANSGEIDRAVALTAEYPDIIKVIAVGNEAMVHWAS
ncbi:MAG: glycosyl hydrolase family 17, partial [Flavobacteriaceae bacterium]